MSDCAVIQIPDLRSGEVPKAFVVRSPAFMSHTDEDMARTIMKHVEEHKAPYKWLKGGVELVEAIPKSPSGKILRRLLRDREKQRKRTESSKL